jgi:hypothetical protein
MITTDDALSVKEVPVTEKKWLGEETKRLRGD